MAAQKTHYWALHRIAYPTLKPEALNKMIQDDTGLPRGVVDGAIYAITKQIQQMTLNGFSITIAGLGTFRPSLTARVADSGDDLGRNSVKNIRVLFTPAKELKQAINEVSCEVTPFYPESVNLNSAYFRAPFDGSNTKSFFSDFCIDVWDQTKKRRVTVWAKSYDPQTKKGKIHVGDFSVTPAGDRIYMNWSSTMDATQPRFQVRPESLDPIV